MKGLKKTLALNNRILLLFAIIAILAVLKPSAFWSWSNISTVVFQQAPFTMLMSFGMTLAIITKGIDKSMGSVLVLSSAVAATLIKADQIVVGILLALVIGAICGILNGILIAKAGIPPFVATYGVDFITLGVAYVYTGGISTYGFSDGFRSISTFSVGGVTSLSVITFAILIALHLTIRYTNFGRSVYLTGSNKNAARLSGLDTTRAVVVVYAINGLLAAITGVLYIARLNAADPGISGNFTLDSIAASLIGGNSFTGGEGSIAKAAVGALIIVFIRNGLNILGVATTWQQTVIGFVILISIGLESITRGISRIRNIRKERRNLGKQGA